MSKVSLKNHFDSRINDVKDSVKTAYKAMDSRLKSMNEFRQTLTDQAAQFIRRDTFDLLQQQVKGLEIDKAKLEGMASQRDVNKNTLISVIAIILSAFSIIMRFI